MSEPIDPRLLEEMLTTRTPKATPLADNVRGLVLLLVVCASLAWPVGLACRAIWILFLHGWEMI